MCSADQMIANVARCDNSTILIPLPMRARQGRGNNGRMVSMKLTNYEKLVLSSALNEYHRKLARLDIARDHQEKQWEALASLIRKFKATVSLDYIP